jgi:hypothetical protein
VSRANALRHEFVEFMPDTIEDGTLYVSMPYATAIHKCCCGCGNEVVTPFSPTDWRLTFDGVGVSLAPSIGNWSFPCRSHYWIRGDRVDWAESWTDDRVRMGRESDAAAKADHYAQGQDEPVKVMETDGAGMGFWAKLKGWLFKR